MAAPTSSHAERPLCDTERVALRALAEVVVQADRNLDSNLGRVSHLLHQARSLADQVLNAASGSASGLDEALVAREMARLGGYTTLARHGRQHYSKIGKRGGARLLEKRGREHFAAMGRKGGRARADAQKAAEESVPAGADQ